MSLEKRALRQAMRALRDGLAPGFRAEASRSITAQIQRLDAFRSASGILACLPLGSEVDLTELINNPGHGRAVYIPRVDLAGRRLDICRYPCELVKTGYGLTEPAPSVPSIAQELLTASIQLALVPGLAFSRSTFHRLGYGGGFFDSFLASHPIKALGVGYACQLLASVPHDTADRPLDGLISELGVACRKKG